MPPPAYALPASRGAVTFDRDFRDFDLPPPRKQQRPPPTRVRSSPVAPLSKENNSNDSGKSISFCDVAQQAANDTQPGERFFRRPDGPESEVDVTPLRALDSNASAVLMPRTPIVSGKKRRSNGELVNEPRTSATKTPGSAMRKAIGATAAADFSYSQAFDATQVQTSPPANAPKSDPVFGRPSPQVRLLVSSPPAFLISSPVKAADTPCSERITDSQTNTQLPRIPTSSQPVISSAPTILHRNQESVFSHLSAGEQEQFGSETQGALRTSSPIGPPRGSSISQSQDRKSSMLNISVRRSHILEEPNDSQAASIGQGDDRVPATQESVISNVEDDLVTDTAKLEELYPNRILAYCGGQYNMCFPATLGQTIPCCASFKLEAKFDDGSSVVVPTEHLKWVFKLSLQYGDVVKVDLPNMKGKNYVVRGFRHRLGTGTQSRMSETPFTDIFGHQTVVVCAKTRRSLGGDESSDLVDVPVSAVKIGHMEFPQFSKGKREFLPMIEESVRPNTVRSDSQSSPLLVFENMAFAVTVDTKAEKKRDDIEQLIRIHGGRLLTTGFEELFELSALLSADAADDDDPRTATTTATALQLKPSAQSLGFTALIADAHSRRQKHVLALALNLPVLHYQWVADSVGARTPLPWAPYLLPAGSAARLAGAVRSRALAPYDPRDDGDDGGDRDGKGDGSGEAALRRGLARRARLLDGCRVLAVVGRLDERRRAYLFLCVALGAAEIARVRDVAAAKARLDEGWDWVYADVGADKARRALGREVPLLDDEVVVQSLIWGSLVV